jgi:hypothetical protein
MALQVASVSRTHWTGEVYEPSDDSFTLVDALEQDAAGWKAAQPRTCAEIGCGSGYVICSLALLLRQLGIRSSLYATDVSQHALDATRQTLASHGVASVELLRTNVLGGLLGRLERRVDILVRRATHHLAVAGVQRGLCTNAVRRRTCRSSTRRTCRHLTRRFTEGASQLRGQAATRAGLSSTGC